MKTSAMKIIVCLLLVAMLMGVSSFAAMQVAKYAVHDKERQNPPVIAPPAQLSQPPSDAIILFDGEDTSEWESERKGGGEVPWKIDKENGYVEVSRKGGGIRTKKTFGNCQLHVEWCTPEGIDPRITDQKRSNSGVFLMDRYEVQVLDSYTDDNYQTNRTYADGQAAAMYGQHPPMVNVCRKPGQWQTYDISFLKPLFDENGKLVRKARITVLHNGVVVHNNLEIEGTTSHKVKAAYRPHPNDEGHIRLQDHSNPIRFRNIWIRELPEQPYLIK
jgi:hypothetical protein